MSFKYITAKFFKNSYNMSFTNAYILINVLINLNGIIVYLKHSKLVRNAVFYFLFFIFKFYNKLPGYLISLNT
jgi:hypothetical protein